MMKTWNQLVTISIDPAIKQFDKEIDHEIEKLSKDVGYSIVDSKHSLFKKNLFSVKFVPLGLEKRTIKTDTDLTIALSNSNLDFLTDEVEMIDQLIFHELKELKGLFSLIKYAVDKIIKENENIIQEKADLILKKQVNKLSKESLNKTQIKLLDQLEWNLYQCHQLNDFFEFFEKTNETLLKDITIYPASMIFQHSIEMFIPLMYQNQSLYFLKKNNEQLNLIDLLVYQSLVGALKRLEINQAKKKNLKDIEDVFSQLMIPIAIFDKEQHLLLHNAHFINLNLSAKKVFALKVNDQLTIANEVYKVQKIFIDDGKYIHISFIPVKEFLGQSQGPSTEELGIVSSSIAHELNNPLGGILAALNVLELDDVTPEVQMRFDQMRDGIMRCKKLVETFLGFSKMKPLPSKETEHSLRDCFNQAMDLVRFRLIENNIVFNGEYKIIHPFTKDFNSSLMTMVLYLIFGEVLTNFSHQKLVTQGNSPKINYQFEENQNQFGLVLSKEYKLSETFLESKLIKHLLDSQNIHMIYADDKCIFS